MKAVGYTQTLQVSPAPTNPVEVFKNRMFSVALPSSVPFFVRVFLGKVQSYQAKDK